MARVSGSSVACAGLAEDFLKDYIQVNIGSLDLCANHNITQIVEVCEDYEKDHKCVATCPGLPGPVLCTMCGPLVCAG